MADLDYIEQNGQKFIHVSTISTAAANEQFMQNVQLVQRQRQALVALSQILSPKEKELMAGAIKDREAALNKNNAQMTQSYGFSLARNYVHQIVNSQVFIKLTDEEYNKAKEEGVPADQFLVRANDKFRLIAKIPGAVENDLFRHNVQIVQAQRDRLVQMNAALAQMQDGEAKSKLEEEIKTATQRLEADNKTMTEKYGFSLTRNYLLQVVESKLYTAVNEEEFLKAQQAKPAEEAPAKE
ncbi:MAG: hypothetical protein K6B46_06765 [Opitutales bacterium]|nr:hypothetical protein [Opitutales bacterium]